VINAAQIEPTEILNAFSRAGILLAMVQGISDSNLDKASELKVSMSRNGRTDKDMLDAVTSQLLANLVEHAKREGGCVMMEVSDWPKIEIDDMGATVAVRVFVRPYVVPRSD
jgi:hypothetical protein